MMVEKNARVGVLMGGLSTEHDVSMQSGAAVLGALKARGWDAVAIHVDRHLPATLIEHRVDVAWVCLHGRFGEDGCVQGLLEVMGIPYTGCDVRSSAVAMDKIATKRAVEVLEDVVMARDAVYRAGQALPSLNWPVICKPAVGGSTIGMTICHDNSSLQVGLDEALKLNEEVLVEEVVEGDEITAAVLDGQALPIVAIIPDSGFFDFEAKYTKGRTRYVVPAPIDEAVAQHAQRAAVAVYKALGCQGLCRADFIVRADGVPVFLEINTIPGMTATSLSPMAAGSAGVSFEELVERVLLGAHRMAVEGI
jgi:D-alanine-D-alanine ligase